MEPLVYAVVLCYNERKWLERCLSSLLQSDYPNFKAVLVDNASTDGSADFVQERFSEVEVVRNEKNLGFAEGNNVGIRYALSNGADYVMLLNADTHVAPDMLSKLVALAEANEDLAIITPMIFDYEGKAIDRNCMQLVKLSSELINDLWAGRLKEFYFIDSASGAAMFMRRKLFERVGLIDPLYFIYFEEIDLCRRALYHGMKAALATQPKVFHFNRLETSPLGSLTTLRFERGYLIFLLKNPSEPAPLCLVRYLLEANKRIAGAILRRHWKRAAALCKIYAELSLRLPHILWRRHLEIHHPERVAFSLPSARKEEAWANI